MGLLALIEKRMGYAYTHVVLLLLLLLLLPPLLLLLLPAPMQSRQ
jgi:hypothetical protein